MNKKFISVFMIGAATLASLSTVTSCKDYDDDINDLQERLDGTGVDLKSEVTRLEGLLSSCKAACEKADTELNETIKNATNDAKGYADIQAAEAKKAAVEASQALIEQAIADLEAGAVNAAQTKADAAYSLAEQVQKTAADNEKNIAKIVDDLATAKDNLEKADKALENKLSEAEKKIKTAQDGVDANAASIVTLENSLKSLKESNEKALAALSDKDDELKKLIDDNQDSIKKLLEDKVAAQKLANEAFDAAIKANAKAVKDLEEGKVQDNADAIAKITERVEKLEDAVATLKSNKVDVTTFNTTIESVKGLITTLETGKVKDNADAIAALKAENGPIKKNAEAIRKIVDEELVKINNYLDILAGNLNNLITGLILQDEQLEIVQAKVVSDVNRTLLSGKTFTEVKNGKTFVIFPYKGAAGADANTLIVDQWNVERVAGPVYYTINPTDVNFTDKANINIENSLEKAPAGLKFSAPEASTRTSAITRAAEEAKAPKNGLYQSIVTNNDLHRTSKHPGYENSYALFTRYNQTDKNKKVTEKKVYSKYALNINVVDAAVQTTPSVVAVAVGDRQPSPTPRADALYTANFGEDLQGKLKLEPVNTEFGKSGATPKVYRKYVEAVAVSNARNEAQTGTKLTTLLKAINNANSGILNTIFEEDDANFDAITVTIPDAEGDYSFIGSTVTFRYYIQNYNGTIYSKDYKVMFTKTLFKENKVTIEHAPYQSGVNTIKNGLTKESKTDFQTEANCITVGKSNELWIKNTAKIVITAKGNTPADKADLTSVEFYSDSKLGNGWVSQPAIKNANFTSNVATIDGLIEAEMSKIKNMIFTYDPSKLEVEKTYELVMSSYDANGNLISELPIEFKMVDPKHHAELINPNPAFFTPFDDKLTAATLEGKTLTAWANNHVASAVTGKYDANYNIICAFNKLGNSYAPQADGCVISFDYTDKVDYVTTDPAKPAKYAAFKPVNNWRLKWNTAETDYTMTVPAAAVLKGSEHPYNLQVAVEEFGVPSLWYKPVPFKVVFKSAIAYTDLKFSKDAYEIDYPNTEIVITDDMITADDPSTSLVKDIKYFNNSTRDDRIKDVKIVLKDTQFASLFSAYSVENDGIHIHTSETIPGGVASITSHPITFQFKVTDYYENTVSYDLKVQVKKNN